MPWTPRYGRRGRCAFWLLGRRRLAVAVLEPTSDEPLLLACAALTIEEEGGTVLDFAPGLLEAAIATQAVSLPHVAALDDDASRLEVAEGESRSSAEGAEVTVPVSGRPGLRVRAARTAIAAVAQRFSSAELRLLALDCAACALLNLSTYLGRDDGDVARALEEARVLDPLTAVSVAPSCEAAAARAAASLAVPIGLALGRFGLVRDG